MSDTDYRNLPDDQLLMWYRNARTTWAQYTHTPFGKAARNLEMCRLYATEMTARGLSIPQDAARDADGVFNGPGAV